MKPFVVNLDGYRKQVFYPGQETALILDFKPFIETFTLDEGCCLIHWQAKPKYHRRWGVFDSQKQTYEAFLSLSLEGSFEAIQLNESEVLTVPTAVLIARSPLIEKDGDFAIITGN